MKLSLRRKIIVFISPITTWSRHIYFKRYNISLFHFSKVLVHNIQEDEILTRSHAVSFNFLLAIFPAIIFLFTLIPFLHTYFPNISTATIIDFFNELMPPSIFEIVSGTILDILSIPRGGLLTLGFIFALYASTNGMLSLMQAFNACYRTVEKRNVLIMRFTATALTFMMAAAIIVVIVLLVVGQLTLNYVIEHIEEFSHLKLDQFTVYMLFTIRFFIIFLVLFLSISCIYYFGPAVQKNWRFFSLGSIVATLGVLGTCYGFSFFITNFSTYNKVYGSLGAIIALMIWTQLLTLVLLAGYEINATLHYGRKRAKRNNAYT